MSAFAIVKVVLSALRNPWILLLITGVIGVAGTGWYRMQYHDCQAERAADKVAAEKARSEAIAKAQATSDRIITEQAAALAATAAKVGGITERIIHVPVTTACAQSPAVRAAVDGVRELFNSGGRQAPAGSGAAAAMPGSGPRRQP